MARAKKAKAVKTPRMTTEEALEALLGHKAAKRIREVAERLANEDRDKKHKKADKKR